MKRTKTLPSPPSSSHCHFVETYVTGEKISSVLREKESQIRRYAYIFHDQDLWENDVFDDESNYIHHKGDLKEAHWHILLDLTTNRKPAEIRDWFADVDFAGRPVNTLDQIAVSKVKCWEYLTHTNAPDKFQYSVQGIVTNDRYYFETLVGKKDADDGLVQAVDEYLAGASTSWLLTKYGRDFLMNYQRIKLVADAIAYEEDKQSLVAQLSGTVFNLETRIKELNKELDTLQTKIKMARIMCANEVTK